MCKSLYIKQVTNIYSVFGDPCNYLNQKRFSDLWHFCLFVCPSVCQAEPRLLRWHKAGAASVAAFPTPGSSCENTNGEASAPRCSVQGERHVQPPPILKPHRTPREHLVRSFFFCPPTPSLP